MGWVGDQFPLMVTLPQMYGVREKQELKCFYMDTFWLCLSKKFKITYCDTTNMWPVDAKPVNVLVNVKLFSAREHLLTSDENDKSRFNSNKKTETGVSKSYSVLKLVSHSRRLGTMGRRFYPQNAKGDSYHVGFQELQ